MSALPFELPTQLTEVPGPELFDVNEVLSSVLDLGPSEEISAIEAHNVVYMEPYKNRVIRGKGKLAVQFTVDCAASQETRLITQEIDAENRPFPEQLIAAFGAMALKADKESGHIERFDFLN